MARRTVEQLAAFDDKAKAGGFRFIFGVDEAGRGPLAGPVVAAAVWVRDPAFTVPVGDSKKLSERQREKAFHEIHDRACVGVGIMSEAVIDQVNILKAAHLAMAAAVGDLVTHLPQDIKGLPDFATAAGLLIDGNMFTAKVPFRVGLVVEGDGKSLSIACASIIAKVTRDRIIEQYDRIYPQYGFAKHKGYPTAAHRAAIACHGLSPIHRRSFRSS